jgi:putative ABC transport system permease protein
MEKKLGDPVVVVVSGAERTLSVSGIYQDVTNGGKTAKALLPADESSILRYMVAMDVAEGVSVQTKQAQYDQFSGAQVTDLSEYVRQTMGGMLDNLQLVNAFAYGIAILLILLITSLFIKMLIAKDEAQIAILRSIGFNLFRVRMQYMVLAFIVVIVSLLIGTLLANTAGEALISFIMSFQGAAQVQLIVDPLQAYVFSPLLFISLVLLSTLLVSIQSIKSSAIARTLQ